MKRAYGIRLNCQIFKSVDEATGLFNIVCAIDYKDYEPYLDYSDRKRMERDVLFTEKPYLAATDLIEAANLASEKNALVIMSYGRDILSQTPETANLILQTSNL